MASETRTFAIDPESMGEQLCLERMRIPGVERMRIPGVEFAKYFRLVPVAHVGDDLDVRYKLISKVRC